MRIAALADLHFSPQSYDRIREPMSRLRDEADLLILAGDITNLGKPEEMESMLASFLRIRVPIVAVLGNHDFESGRQEELAKMMIAEGVKVLDGSAIVCGFRRLRLRNRSKLADQNNCFAYGMGPPARNPNCSSLAAIRGIPWAFSWKPWWRAAR